MCTEDLSTKRRKSRMLGRRMLLSEDGGQQSDPLCLNRGGNRITIAFGV